MKCRCTLLSVPAASSRLPAPNLIRSEHRLVDTPFFKQERTRFAAAVRSWRTAAGLPRSAVAAKLGVSAQQIKAIEDERASPSHAVLVYLRKEMGLGSLSL